MHRKPSCFVLRYVISYLIFLLYHYIRDNLNIGQNIETNFVNMLHKAYIVKMSNLLANNSSL